MKEKKNWEGYSEEKTFELAKTEPLRQGYEVTVRAAC